MGRLEDGGLGGARVLLWTVPFKPEQVPMISPSGPAPCPPRPPRPRRARERRRREERVGLQSYNYIREAAHGVLLRGGCLQ